MKLQTNIPTVYVYLNGECQLAIRCNEMYQVLIQAADNQLLDAIIFHVQLVPGCDIEFKPNSKGQISIPKGLWDNDLKYFTKMLRGNRK